VSVRTPGGRECKHYYEDFHRGANRQECRLVRHGPESPAWRPELCSTCPVPDILRVNSCPNMILEARVARRLLGFVQRVEVTAWCKEHFMDVPHPAVGCGHCHEQDRPSTLNSPG
jgi:hypothetical protein